MNDRHLRLTILGGFLGAGKTTWLRHQLHAGVYAGAVVLVNEAACTPVDHALLTRAADLRVLAGGCACCAGQGALIAVLRDLCDSRSRAPSASAGQIVLETSGLADPGAIVAAVQRDPVLVHHIRLAGVVVAVDALHGLAHLVADPLGRRQVEAADHIVITKTDAAAPAVLADLLATLHALAPAARISGAAHGSACALPAPGTAQPLPGGGAVLAPLFPTALTLDADRDWPAFAVWLSALLHARGDDVVRVKGVLGTPAGRLLVQAVRRVVAAPEVLPDAPGSVHPTDNTVVVIGRGYTADNLRRSFARFRSL